MPSPLSLGIILLAISIVLGILAVYKVFRIINTVLTALILVFALGSLWLSYDLQQLQKELGEQGQVFVLSENGELVTLFYSVTGQIPEYVSDTSAQKAAYARADLASIKGERALLFEAATQTFSGVESVTLGKYSLDTGFVLERLREQDPRVAYVDRVKQIDPELAGKQVALPDIAPEEFRSLLFAALTTEYLQENNLADAIRTGGLKPYPSRPTFWLLKKIPKQVLDIVIAS